MTKWIKCGLMFLVLFVVVFIGAGKLIALVWPNITDYLASWFNTVGVEETTDLLFDLTFGITLIISLIISVLFILIRRHA
ncbi:hypothetical protein OYY33_004739 [Escherichia coli]|nr:hypothetical protein [Escherichia coli]